MRIETGGRVRFLGVQRPAAAAADAALLAGSGLRPAIEFQLVGQVRRAERVRRRRLQSEDIFFLDDDESVDVVTWEKNPKFV